MNKRCGFSLVELSVVIVIVGLLAASALTGAEIFIERTRRDITRDRLVDIKAALQEYATVNGGMLPCPAARNLIFGDPLFGFATDCTVAPPASVTDTGAVRIGAVPVRTLNLPADYIGDSWNGKFTYAMTEAMATSGTANGAITIQDGSGTTITNPAGQGAWIVVSHGRNRMGAYGVDSTAIGIACTGTTPEEENCDNNVTFNDAMYNDGIGAAAYFDDYVIWGMRSRPTANSFYVTTGNIAANAVNTACMTGYSICGNLQWTGRAAITSIPTVAMWVNGTPNCTNWTSTAVTGTTVTAAEMMAGTNTALTCGISRPVMCCSNNN